MIKCCIFDLDGTVLDTIATITHFVNVTLQKHGFSEITEEECKVFVGDTLACEATIVAQIVKNK